MRTRVAVAASDSKYKDRASELVEVLDRFARSEDVLKNGPRLTPVWTTHAAKVRNAKDPDDITLPDGSTASVLKLQSHVCFRPGADIGSDQDPISFGKYGAAKYRPAPAMTTYGKSQSANKILTHGLKGNRRSSTVAYPPSTTPVQKRTTSTNVPPCIIGWVNGTGSQPSAEIPTHTRR
jgi:hypothetical protein